MDDFFRLFQKLGGNGNHTVVKTRPDCQNHIGIVHGQIGFVSAVHAQHAQILSVIGRIRAQAHQRRGTGQAGEFDKLRQLVGSITQNHAAAEIHQRPFRCRQHLYGLLNLTDVSVENRLVGADKNVFLRIAELGHRLGNVFGDVDNHRAGTAAAGNLEGFFYRSGQIIDILDQEIMLHTRPRHADHIDFLKRIRTDGGRADLAGNHHQRNRIGIGRGDAGERVGRAGARSHQSHADLAADTGIGIGGMYRSLFVPYQDMFEFVELEKRVVDFEYRAAGIAENVFDVFRLQTLHKNLCTG